MKATTRHEIEIRALIAERGLTIEQRGIAWRIHGVGVDVLTLDLASVTRATLEPHTPRGNNE